MSETIVFEPAVSRESLAHLGEGLIAYVKPINSEDVANLFPQAPEIAPGLKLFAPPGVRLFSVGDGGVVVVVVVLDGAGDSLLPQAAVSEPMAMIALPPATSARRRTQRSDFIVDPIPNLPLPVTRRHCHR